MSEEEDIKAAPTDDIIPVEPLEESDEVLTDDYIKHNEAIHKKGPDWEKINPYEKHTIPKAKLACGNVSHKVPVVIDEKTTIMLTPEKAEAFTEADRTTWKIKYLGYKK